MTIHRKREFIYKLLSIFLIISIIALVFLSYSVITILPPLKVKHLEVDTDNPALVRVLKGLLKERFHNNVLLIYLNRGTLERLLQERTLFYTKGVTLEGFSVRSGTLKVDIETRKPVAVLNRKFLISPEGVIFGFIEPQADLRIEDLSRPWRYGEEYRRVDLSYLKHLEESFGIHRVEVKENLVLLRGKKLEVLVPLEGLKSGGIEKVLSKLEQLLPSSYKEVALLGGKGDVYIKIIKERTDE